MEVCHGLYPSVKRVPDAIGEDFFTPSRGAKFIQLPCGQCIGCRLAHSRDWATRCVHEAHMHDHNCFITLTYSPENLPEGGTLVRKHFTDFMKRLRKALSVDDISIRFFGCGEYGSKLERPHYHAIIFGYDFPDKTLHKAGRFNLFRSSLLERCWTLAFLLLLALALSRLHMWRDTVLKKSPVPVQRSIMDIAYPSFQL